MKKVLSVVLSVMLFAIMLVPAAYALVTPGVTIRAAEGEYAEDAVAKEVIEDTTFTVYFKMPAVEKLTGVSMYVDFDKSVLEVVEGGQAGKIVEGTLTPYFRSGIFASGIKTLADNQYAFGWSDLNGIDKSKATDFSYLTFKVKDPSVSSTTLNLYINEFKTDDGDDDNDVNSTTLAESKVVYFNFEDVSIPETSEAETEPTSPQDINDLIQIIKDMLSGNGATFEDFADAITNILGNADITDMIEQLIGGDIDIGGGFSDLLGGLDLDFGAFEDILNTIIDFFKGLFGPGGNDDPVNPTQAPTQATNTTQAASGDPATTANGSQQGSEGTGDAGIALAATVCVAAGVAFVLTRKKKETV